MPFPIEVIVLLLFIGATLIFFLLGLVCTFLQGRWPWNKKSSSSSSKNNNSTRNSTKESSLESSWKSHDDRVLPSPLTLPTYLLNGISDNYPFANDPYFYDFYGGSASDSRRSSATSLATHRLSETILAVGWSPNCSITLDPDYLDDIAEERSNSSTYNPSISSVLINEDYRNSTTNFEGVTIVADSGIVNPMYENTEVENMKAKTPSLSRQRQSRIPEVDDSGPTTNITPHVYNEIVENGIMHGPITVTITEAESDYSTTMF